MKIRHGHIPREIVYIFRGSIKVAQKWEETSALPETTEYQEVFPCFVAETDRPNSIREGEGWVLSWGKDEPVTRNILENKPIKDLQLLGIEPLMDGSRYKVVTTDGFYFNFREDVLLDAIMTVGCRPGGILNGEYVWSNIEHQMHLIRVDSEMYRALLESGERNCLSPLEKKNLQVGGIYENKQGNKSIFMGWAETESWRENSNYEYVTRKHKTMMWFDITDFALKNNKLYDPLDIQVFFDKSVAAEGLYHGVILRNSHSMVKLVGHIDVPKNIEEIIQKQAVVTYKEYIDKVIRTRGNSHAVPIVFSAAGLCLLRKKGSSRPLVDEVYFQRVQENLK